MAKCVFCGKQIPMGRGIVYVEVSGRIHNFCSHKCQMNRRMGRDPSRVKWVTKGKE